MAVEIISWPNLYERSVTGPKIETETSWLPVGRRIPLIVLVFVFLSRLASCLMQNVELDCLGSGWLFFRRLYYHYSIWYCLSIFSVSFEPRHEETCLRDARMRRLICAFVVRILHKQVFSWRGSFTTSVNENHLQKSAHPSKRIRNNNKTNFIVSYVYMTKTKHSVYLILLFSSINTASLLQFCVI